jgi:glycosyltransferase involved in cell wall biosynthesis
MNVLLLGLSPSVGMQFYTAGVANTLAEAGHQVWVAGADAERASAYDCRVRLVSGFDRPETGPSRSAFDPFQLWRLLRFASRIDPAVIHMTGPHLWNWPVTRAFFRRVPLILTQHDATTHLGGSSERLKRVFRQAVMAHVDCVLVHSQAVAQALACPVRVLPLVHHNFDYNLYRRIRDDEAYAPRYDSLAILFGRLEEYKGVRQFAAAAQILAAAGEDGLRLVIAGSGRLSEELSCYDCPPNLEIRSRLLGDRETIALFEDAGLVVLPYSEGSQSALIPLAYLFQKPVLVTRVGALAECVRDGETGIVIDSNEPSLLARKLGELLGNKERLADMGRAGKALLLTMEADFRSGLLDIYDSLARSVPEAAEA